MIATPAVHRHLLAMRSSERAEGEGPLRAWWTRHHWHVAAVVAMVVALQTLLPQRIEETRAAEIVGKLRQELAWRPRGVQLSLLTDFAWDRACLAGTGTLPETFETAAGARLGDWRIGEGDAWTLIFALGDEVVAAAPVPSSLGEPELPGRQRVVCAQDPGAYVRVTERSSDHPSPRSFRLGPG